MAGAVLAEKYAGLGINEMYIKHALKASPVPEKFHKWTQEDLLSFAASLRRQSKPMIIAANKWDLAPPDKIRRLRELEGYIVIPTAAEYELGLRRAAKAGVIHYMPGARDFTITDPSKPNPAQKKGLEKFQEFLSRS